MTITLQLTAYRARSTSDRRAVSDAYWRAIGNVPSGVVVKRIIDDVGHALTTLTAPTVAIDVSGASPLELTSVTVLLTSFGHLAPVETPPDWVRQFIRDLEAADPKVVVARRQAGFPAV